MGWFMPSYGRPERLRELLDAPGGWPATVVLVNEDDPQLTRYKQVRDQLRFEGKNVPWTFHSIPAGSRCADAHRFITTQWPEEKFYGLVEDGHWPITPGWHDALAEAAGDRYISVANGEPSFPKIRTAAAFGGELVRAMGSLVPLPVKHNYEDNCWDQIAEDFGLLRPLRDVIVEHQHWIRGSLEKDETFERGSADFHEDEKIFKEWLFSDERRAMAERISNLLGGTYTIIDPRAIKLCVALPIHDSIDPRYHFSYGQLQTQAVSVGLSLTEVSSFGGSHIAKARERVLWDAWRHNPTHILFIDSDMGFDPKLVFRLLAADVEFACAVGVRKTDKQTLCCNFYEGAQELHPVNRFVKIKDVNFAFVLLKRTVIEKMVAAYPELAYSAGPNVTEYALFLDMIDGRERLSEDYSFCRRWTAIGGEIWADRHAALIHVGRKEYTGSIDELFEGAERVEMTINRAA